MYKISKPLFCQWDIIIIENVLWKTLLAITLNSIYLKICVRLLKKYFIDILTYKHKYKKNLIMKNKFLITLSHH